MTLALDVGNSQIFGGLFVDGEIRFRFRKNSQGGASSDELGIFLRSVLQENGYDPRKVQNISVCSVVPQVVHSLRNACRKYFSASTFFLEPGVKTGLQIKYLNPIEVGADRIANSIAATAFFPQRNLIIIDLGTATTFCAVSRKMEYLGGVIISGMRLNMEALESKTAKLPSVEILATERCLGKSTVSSIQSGLYFGHLGQMREITRQLTEECFPSDKPFVIGTGGFSSLFEKEKIFDTIQPDLVLHGLNLALIKNLQVRGTEPTKETLHDA